MRHPFATNGGRNSSSPYFRRLIVEEPTILVGIQSIGFGNAMTRTLSQSITEMLGRLNPVPLEHL
jgi:hypothetical protein